jgi:hypothetical protein
MDETMSETAKAAADYSAFVHGLIDRSRQDLAEWESARLAEAAKPRPEPLKEMYEGKLREVVNPDRQGWWRFHEHYDRDGYCDNPGRGY